MKAMQLVLLFALGVSMCSAQLPAYSGYIRVQNGRFVDDNCQEFIPMGINTWQLLEAQAGALTAVNAAVKTVPNTLNFTLQQAVSNCQNVIRAFGHGTNYTFPLQVAPGQYNEAAFKALDTIIAQASAANVKLLLTFGDNWQEADSKPAYLNWTNNIGNSNAFFSDPQARQLYKNHIAVMANRTNTVNGRKYSADPTIFAWNLMNEVRCDCFPVSLYPAYPTNAECLPSCGDLLTNWVTEMSAFYKTVFPNTLLTLGIEGYWGQYSPQVQYNPGNGWAGISGQNFTVQETLQRNIDFCAVHYWPDRWTVGQANSAPNFLQTWMGAHAAECSQVGKPLIIEEFGKTVDNLPVQNGDITANRDPFFQNVYSYLNQTLVSTDPATSITRGALFWKWAFTPANPQNDVQAVAVQDTTFANIIRPSSCYAATLARPVTGCQARTAATTAPAGVTSAGRKLAM
jgi:mannan endo-1,4-beta-mannosidase